MDLFALMSFLGVIWPCGCPFIMTKYETDLTYAIIKCTHPPSINKTKFLHHFFQKNPALPCHVIGLDYIFFFSFLFFFFFLMTKNPIRHSHFVYSSLSNNRVKCPLHMNWVILQLHRLASPKELFAPKIFEHWTSWDYHKVLGPYTLFSPSYKYP